MGRYRKSALWAIPMVGALLLGACGDDDSSGSGSGGVTIRYFQTGSYMRYLVNSGQVDEGQLDGSYDGTPAVFVSEGGKIAQQGFASAEPYIYEHEVKEWGKPVAFQLVHDAGWQTYAAPLAVRAEEFDGLKDCLAKFVPIVQESVVDFVADPSRVTPIVLDLVEQYDTGWVYSQGVADFSNEQMAKLGLISNGPDDTIGNFDDDRLADFIPKALKVFQADDDKVPDLTAGDLTTNEFIDEGIGLDSPSTDLDTDLSDVCPDTIVIQTDWNPEMEHGALYNMLGDDYTVDTGKKTVKGPLVIGGEDTGIDIEIRVGGPAIGFQDVAVQMQQDPDITMGYVATDEAIKNWNLIKTRAVVAPMEINPQIIMWDPATYPDVQTIADLKDA